MKRKSNFGGRKQRRIKFSYPRGNFPRLCLIGNSNVGKSSLTKSFLSNPKFYTGKIGKTPGSTIKLNLIDDKNLPYQIVDLPGFGKMIRLQKNKEIKIQEQILEYIEIDQRNIFLCLEVVNMERLEDELEKYYFKRRDTIPLTIEFLLFILEQKVPCVLVLNKMDKLNIYDKKRVMKKLKRVLRAFSISIRGNDADYGLLSIVQTSMKTKEGLSELKKIIQNRVRSLDYSNYDARNELYKKKPVEKK